MLRLKLNHVSKSGHWWINLIYLPISQGFSLRLPCIDVYMYVHVSCMIPMYFMEMYVFVIICILYDPYVLN